MMGEVEKAYHWFFLLLHQPRLSRIHQTVRNIFRLLESLILL